ncbi:Hypothetical predicted protein [Olea europaea subsp. europaea]|uniref:Uncharacterized protein n=1 Tax=Olea europaea subsp. europaea TaxID=158383 RepID=A0A8S0RWX4_OLEEU|nr:Hypothetical predicted protein [Olea europaea subsp. europaea]
MGCEVVACGGSKISGSPVGSSGASNSSCEEGSEATQDTDGDGSNPSSVLAGRGVEAVSSGDAQSGEMEDLAGPKFGTWGATDGKGLRHGGRDITGARGAYVDGVAD